jgi:hypothetical protein
MTAPTMTEMSSLQCRSGTVDESGLSNHGWVVVLPKMVESSHTAPGIHVHGYLTWLCIQGCGWSCLVYLPINHSLS